MDKQKILCRECGGKMKRYDCVRRVVRTGDTGKKIVFVERYHCTKCGRIYRMLPENLIPYKQYDSRIIKGVLEGEITQDTIGYEDYPSEETIKRWKKEYHDFPPTLF